VPGLFSHQARQRGSYLQGDVLRIAPKAYRFLSTTQRLRLTALADRVAIRDQLPMPAASLQRCLQGLTPAQGYLRLNQKVFFFGVAVSAWTVASRWPSEAEAFGIRERSLSDSPVELTEARAVPDAVPVDCEYVYPGTSFHKRNAYPGS
jgi:hypothetical protein